MSLNRTKRVGPALISVDETVRIYDLPVGYCDWGGCTDEATHFAITIISGIEIRPVCERHAERSVSIYAKEFPVAAIPARFS